MKIIRLAVIKIVIEEGKIIRQNIVRQFAPSTRAASIKLDGISRKNCVKRKSTRPSATPGK